MSDTDVKEVTEMLDECSIESENEIEVDEVLKISSYDEGYKKGYEEALESKLELLEYKTRIKDLEQKIRLLEEKDILIHNVENKESFKDFIIKQYYRKNYNTNIDIAVNCIKTQKMKKRI